MTTENIPNPWECHEPRRDLTFDEWYAAKNCGHTFEQDHMRPGAQWNDAIVTLLRLVRDYVSEMVR
jgi:hypothetical protein